MESLLSKIREYGGSEYDFVLAGQLDMEAIEAFMEAKEMERLGKVAELRRLGSQSLMTNLMTGESVSFEDRPAVIEYIASTFSGYDTMEKEEQERIRLMISSNFDYYIDQIGQQKDKMLNAVQEMPSDAEGLEAVGEFISKHLFGSLGETYFGSINAFALKDEAKSLINDIQDILNDVEGVDATDVFTDFFLLDPDQQEHLKNLFGQDLKNILAYGQDTITSFANAGRSVGEIGDIASGFTAAAQGIEIEGGGTLANELTEDFLGLVKNLSPTDTADYANAVQTIIDSLDEYNLTAEQVSDVTSQIISNFTNESAFQSGVDSIRSAASAYTALKDALEGFQGGEIADNIEALLLEYPQLMEDFTSGELTDDQIFEAVTDNLYSGLNKSLSDLRLQLANETDAAEREIIQSQIDMLEQMMEDPTFIMGQMFEDHIAAIEERYKAEIDFLKELNSEKEKEIDLMEKRLDMNKSMLALDRQIAALSRDTSYGAQARGRDLQEQQRAAAIEREKFVMDLITEQAISDLEKKRDENVQSIRDNVQAIVDGMNSGSTNNTAETISAYAGFRIAGG